MSHDWVERLTTFPAELEYAVLKIGPELLRLQKQTNAYGFVVKGHSGMVLASALSMYMQIPFCMVRNRVEHPVCAGSGPSGLGCAKGNTWIFLDDLIDSGGTQGYVRDTLATHGHTVVGILLYACLDSDYRGVNIPIVCVQALKGYLYRKKEA